MYGKQHLLVSPGLHSIDEFNLPPCSYSNKVQVIIYCGGWGWKTSGNGYQNDAYSKKRGTKNNAHFKDGIFMKIVQDKSCKFLKRSFFSQFAEYGSS